MVPKQNVVGNGQSVPSSP